MEVQAGCHETRHVPPVTETLHDCNGDAHTVVVEPGRAAPATMVFHLFTASGRGGLTGRPKQVSL